MPFVRVDVPEGLDRATKARLRTGLHDCIVKTWFKEHIWIAIQDHFADPNEHMVMLSVGVRPGRGKEAERTQKLYELAQALFEKEIGTQPKEFILTMHEFEQHMCVSGGTGLPSLEEGTPDI
ncbi:MAG: hypothetical protein CBB68_04075 [Rhodospirillaceae bacterium TMED8]|nr:hypothetical protein [Magnetovibrio sp.]OUT52049.1 MAG: hypothetical protein CBB68_04075 [Rhodospirillaceae bacterium TMED8]|tara:strand:- start:758 stop:1123 length:366 start_codon:yes stop_codon:yes gene_type:complete